MPFGSLGGLSSLVEAASALTALEVADNETKTTTTSSPSPNLVSDDDETSNKKTTVVATAASYATQMAAATTAGFATTPAHSPPVVPSAVHNNGKHKKEIFPRKLMEILSDPSLSDVVSWLPHGRSFAIIRPDAFCDRVLPKYLPSPASPQGSNSRCGGTTTKYPSFTRKLNRW